MVPENFIITEKNVKSITKIILLVAFFILIEKNSFSQTSLTTGDVAFTSYNSDNANDSFSIILLTNISASTPIIFTDGGYSDLLGFLSIDGVFEAEFLWNAPTGGLLMGQQITFWRSGGVANASLGSIISGAGLDLSTSGDQIFAIQSGTILAGIHFNFTSGNTTAANWDNRGVLSNINQTDLPNSLTNGVNALYFASQPDNARYNCAITACSASDIRAAVNDSTNWEKNDAAAFVPTICIPTTTTWNGSCWTNNAPNSSVDAIIASSTAPGSFTSKNLTINSAVNLTVNSGQTATTAGTLTNSGNGPTGVGTLRFTVSGNTTLTGNTFSFGGVVEVATGTTLITNDKLTILNRGSLMHGTSTPNGGGDVSGNITIEKSIGTTGKGWRLFSLPIQSTIDNFETGLNTLCSNHTPAGERNVYYWNALMRGGSTQTVASGWEQASASDNQTKGFSIYLDNTSHHTWDFSSTVSMTGTANDGTFNFPLEYTFDPMGDSATASQQGWNLIPNPYPSNLSATALINSAGFGSAYKAVHVWDNNLKQFKAINASTLVNYHTDGGSIYGSYAYIPPFTSFWVKASATSQTVSITNASRTGLTDSLLPDNFMKTGFDVFRLTVKENSAGLLDQLSVCFEDNATEAFDHELDIYKIKTIEPMAPSLYCYADNNLLSLKALPYLKNHRIPVFFESKAHNKEHTFSAVIEHYHLFYDVFLTDLKLNKRVNILKDPYTFTHTEGDDSQRFVLDFMQIPTAITGETMNEPRFYTYVEDNSVYVKLSKHTAHAKVEFYNAVGQKLFATETTNSIVKYSPSFSNGQLIYVTVTTDGKRSTERVIY